MTSRELQLGSASLRSQWFGLLAGPTIWAVYFLAVYGLVEAGCWAGLLGARLPGLNALTITVLVLTLVALLITFYAGLQAYRNWQTMRAGGADYEERGRANERRRFMAFAGALLSALFSLTILITGIPVLVLTTCG